VISPCVADIVHLKNGGTIVADRIEERGGDIVVHQGPGRIVVPRADIASIEKSPPAAAPARPGTSAPGAARPAEPAPTAGDADDDARRLAELRRRLLEPGLARDENRRQIVTLLDHLGETSLRERRPADARRHFEESLTWDAADLRGRRGLAASYLALDQLPLARSVLERALLDAPADADLLVLLGETAARQDRAAEAIALWEKANAARPTPGLKERIEALRRLAAVDAGYVRTEAARFALAYDGGQTVPELEKGILAALDQDFDEQAARFDYLPPGPIHVVLYPATDFYTATHADLDVAGLFDGTIRVPCGGLKRLDAEARAVLAHELAHAFVAGKSGGAAPRWLHEGLARYMEGARTDTATARSLGRQYRETRNPADWGSAFTYESALSFVQFLIDHYGFNALNETLAGLGAGDDTDTALRKATGFSLVDLHRQWGDDLAARLP
jgi:tetratricopeptide (TPR) repeat protein